MQLILFCLLFYIFHAQKNISMDSVAANINALNIEHKQNTNTICYLF